MSDKLTFLHLSDIHFNKRHDGGAFDLDRTLRNELELDLKIMTSVSSGFSGILVTGDIAATGSSDDYKRASEWLMKICSIVGLSNERVWVVPGNHDVTRSTVKSSSILKEFHGSLRRCDESGIDAKLQAFMYDDDLAGNVMVSAFSEYNKFAAAYGCEVEAKKPYWETDFVLDDGSTLRLRGLNSALISDEFDDVEPKRLVVGAAQTNFLRSDDVTYMTMCHHPPDWVRDTDRLEDDLGIHARIQLFGHKHQQKQMPINNNIRIVAGAVHPDRRESKWVPRYNVISVAVSGDASRKLIVQVRPRIWTDEQQFAPDFDRTGKDVREFELRLGPWSPVSVPNPSSKGKTESERSNDDRPSQESAVVQGRTKEKLSENSGHSMSSAEEHRKMVYMYTTLPYHERLKIAQDLNLLSDSDEGVRDPELRERFFKRAVERNILDQLRAKVEAVHAKSKPLTVPTKS